MNPKPPPSSRRGPLPPSAGDASIKAHKQQLFEADELPDLNSTGPGKPFAQHLRETPAAPLPAWLKAALAFAGLVVGALLVAALLRLNRPHPPGPTSTSDLGSVSAASRV